MNAKTRQPESTLPENLAQLAEAAGVDTGYWAPSGTWYQVPESTLIQVLADLDLDASSDAAIEKSLIRAKEAAWKPGLPPVMVVFEDQLPFFIPIVHYRHQGHSWTQWTLTLEEGETRQNFFNLDELPWGTRFTGEIGEMDRRQFWVHDPLPLGYHTFQLMGDAFDQGVAETTLIVAPRRCYQPESFDVPEWRGWGFSVQLYGLRNGNEQGIGDFSVLNDLVNHTADLGGATVGLNPLHTPMLQIPERHSPYSPSCRTLVNPLYVDILSVPEAGDSAVLRYLAATKATREGINQNGLVDYPSVCRWKMVAFEKMFTVFVRDHLQQGALTERGKAFEQYVEQGGDALRHGALFEALSEHFATVKENSPRWSDWPSEYHQPNGIACTRYMAEHPERLHFYQYLFWLAESQLEACGKTSLQRGLKVGLYADMALGVDPDGSDFWRQQAAYVNGSRVGAPPDAFNPQGQNWGLPPFHPQGLAKMGYAPFAEMLRASMRHAGAVRLDHVMSLARLFWIPEGATPLEGAYVRYPVDDLLAIVALESQRNRALVVGEALGNVPDGFREKLAHWGILSYRLLFFERDATGEPLAPHLYDRDATVSASTHDLPTLKGWWLGRDLEWRSELKLFPNPLVERQERLDRIDFRKKLLASFAKAGLDVSGLYADAADPLFSEALIQAAHTWLAWTPGRLQLIQLEDLLMLLEAANLPGTVDQHPNWQRRLAISLDALFEKPEIQNALSVMKNQGR
ncbi:MAG: 4-alpha-glucanotransferase [Magnetococcales bacterium]|nr:4-alpha-glucanotransferase [Magnetococcales bacterium]